MASVHRAIFIWFCLLIFIILLVLQLDRKVEWNWFVIFLPMWFLDSTFFGASMVRFTQIVKSRPRTTGSTANNNATQAALAAYGLKLKRATAAGVASIFVMAFQILLCIWLQYEEVKSSLPLYYVMIPFWLFLMILLGDLSYRLVYMYRH